MSLNWFTHRFRVSSNRWTRSVWILNVWTNELFVQAYLGRKDIRLFEHMKYLCISHSFAWVVHVRVWRDHNSGTGTISDHTHTHTPFFWICFLWFGNESCGFGLSSMGIAKECSGQSLWVFVVLVDAKKKTHECGIVSRLRMLGALHPTINGRMTKSPMKEIVQIFEQCKNSLADFVYWLPRDVNITIWHTKHTVNTHAILAIVVSSAQWKRSSSVLMQIVHSWFVFDTILYRS